jgi:hypothetical protein
MWASEALTRLIGWAQGPVFCCAWEALGPEPRGVVPGVGWGPEDGTKGKQRHGGPANRRQRKDKKTKTKKRPEQKTGEEKNGFLVRGLCFYLP